MHADGCSSLDAAYPKSLGKIIINQPLLIAAGDAGVEAVEKAFSYILLPK